MKFDIDIDSYQGEDLILLVGTPGSKWSSVHRILSCSSDINQTEKTHKRTWGRKTTNAGQDYTIGNHRGVYWGPFNEYGHNFDRLNTLTKEDIVNEFMQPFDDWTKTKIIKSHWFAYHLDFLHNVFPKAAFVSCYAPDDECNYWWKKVGGWGLPFPSYRWYENDNRMLDSIKEENSRILKFNIDRDQDFKLYSFDEIYKELNLEVGNTLDRPRNINDFSCKISIVNKEYVVNFNYLNT
jgi:hypothetical protein